MGIHKKGLTFYIRCDNDCCNNVVELKANTFAGASAEAKRLGWRLRRNKEGAGWVNFCTEFCQMCYEAPQTTIYYTPKDKTILEGTPELHPSDVVARLLSISGTS